MESVIELTKVPDLAPDIPPFTRSWQQKEWERIANAPDIIGIGSYGNGVYDDNWGDDIPWIGLESLQDYSLSLLDIYNQIIDDILNGTYDSTDDIPGTYSEAWEQAISEAWDNVEQSTDAVPGESEKDKPTEGEDTDIEEPSEGESQVGEREIIITNLGNEIDITRSKNHSTTTENPRVEGEANSSVDYLDGNGNIKTRRWFGEDRLATRDVDMTNHGNPKLHPEWPHEHIWEWVNGIPNRY